jgi:hypothetical protein
VHRNPRTVKLPQAQPIAATEKRLFLQTTAPLLTQLAEQRQTIQLASVQNNDASAN